MYGTSQDSNKPVHPDSLAKAQWQSRMKYGYGGLSAIPSIIISVQYFENKLTEFYQICICIDTDKT